MDRNMQQTLKTKFHTTTRHKLCKNMKDSFLNKCLSNKYLLFIDYCFSVIKLLLSFSFNRQNFLRISTEINWEVISTIQISIECTAVILMKNTLLFIKFNDNDELKELKKQYVIIQFVLNDYWTTHYCYEMPNVNIN